MPSVTLLLFGLAALTLDQASKASVLAASRQLNHSPGTRRGLLRCGVSTVVTRGLFGSSRALVALWLAELACLLTLVETIPVFGGLAAPARYV